MGSIVVQAFMTLDGVVQAGGGPDEDRDGGFAHGGWQQGYGEQDDEGDALVAEWESRTEALLLGRRTYEIWSSFWPEADAGAPGMVGDLTRRYNRVPKHVASRTLTELEWSNAHLLGDDVPAAARRVRDETDGEVRVWGSTQLVRTLAEHGLVDEYRLVVYPLVLGTGKRLFAGGFPVSRLGLVGSSRLSSGVLVNTYRRAAEA